MPLASIALLFVDNFPPWCLSRLNKRLTKLMLFIIHVSTIFVTSKAVNSGTGMLLNEKHFAEIRLVSTELTGNEIVLWRCTFRLDGSWAGA